MKKYAYIFVSVLMVVAQLVTNLHIFAYTNTCNSSNKFEITLEKHICSSDCCGTNCILNKSKIESCCNTEKSDEQDFENKCCETKTISIYNALDLQPIINIATINVNVSYTYINNTLLSNELKSQKLQIKDFTSNLPPPISSDILSFLKVLNISQEDDDYYC